jgi:RecB family exonuclease
MLEQFGDNFDLRAVAHRLEQRLTLRVPGRLELVTRVDRIDRGRYGLRLIDYKTGRAQLEASDMREDTAALVHLLAATKLASEPVERLSLFYLRTGEEIYWEPEADDVELAGERLKRILERVTTDASFEPTPGAACQSCPFALACDAALATVSAERALRLA